MARLSLWPLLGFKNSVPRQDIPITALTGPSRDWLVARKRYRRRAGRAIYGDTLAAGVEVSGILESKWGALARRVIAATLASQADDYPCPLLLYTEETNKYATLAWRSRNGTDSWRTIGKEFSATHYPSTGVPQHRVFPLVYRNQYGGLTVHRLNTAEYRAHMAAGARSLLAVRDQVAWAGDCPARWNGKWNDATGSGTEGCEVFPLGLIPPLQMPVCSAGTDLGASTVGPWKGSNAFFFSVCFENESGELSMFAIPRPPGSAWSGYAGFGYFQVDSANPTHYYDSVVYSFIPQGPPGTKYIHLLRSGKVDVATTGAGAVVQPSADDLQFFARVPQGVTTYVDTNGNDLALDPDPRIQEMFRGGGLQWAPAAQYLGRFDGHITAGGRLRTNPYAMLVMPWVNGDRNLPIDNATLYGSTTYFVAVEFTTSGGSKLRLRSVTGGVATDVTYDLTARTLRHLVDLVTSDATVTSTAITACGITSGSNLILRASAFTGVNIGDRIVSSRFPSDAVVSAMSSGGGFYNVYSSKNATASGVALPTGESVTFVHDAVGTTRLWGAQVVPGADAEESVDSLLRTYVGATSNFTNGDSFFTTGALTAQWMNPGMIVVNSGFPAGTVITQVESGGKCHTSAACTRDNAGLSETVDCGYDTGDTTLALLPGFIRMFGNCWPAPIFWSLAYLDRFAADEQATTMTAASPGYAQDGMNTWMVRNRRGGPATLGRFIGMADMGPYELHFYFKGRMRLWNSRTGTTHVDADYTKSVVSWNCGANSPYAICAHNEGVVFSSSEGIFAATAGEGEVWLSEALYDPASPVGSRGELEYALGQCDIAAASGSDSYAIHAQIHGHTLYVRYLSEAGGAYREIRYDFSGSAGKEGIAQFVRPDGSPYPWSAPLTLPVKCSAFVEESDGTHHYAALDSNAGTADGRVDEIDTGTEDNGSLVIPVGYTGLEIPENLDEIQPTMAYVISTKAGDGFKVGLTREPARAPEDAEWDNLDIPSSVVDEFGRSVVWLRPEESVRRAAIGARIWDDGTGPCTEVSMIQVEVERVRSTTSSKRGGS